MPHTQLTVSHLHLTSVEVSMPSLSTKRAAPSGGTSRELCSLFFLRFQSQTHTFRQSPHVTRSVPIKPNKTNKEVAPYLSAAARAPTTNSRGPRQKISFVSYFLKNSLAHISGDSSSFSQISGLYVPPFPVSCSTGIATTIIYLPFSLVQIVVFSKIPFI